MKEYNGILNIKKMNEIEKKAYKSWKDQYQRCNNPKNPRYKWYGEKGIKREYQAREFIAWYVKEYQKKDSWIRPNVDRIDSNKNYCFENIRLIECSENVKLRNKEHGNPVKSKKIMIDNKGNISTYPSIREAARLTGISREIIKYYIKLGKPLKNGLIITYSIDIL